LAETVHIDASDDGLYYEDQVGAWVEDKHRLVSLYETLFSTGMKRKWDVRVCIDLYSGPGLVRVRDTNRFLWGSPLLALRVKNPFDKYICCESNASALSALKTRVGRLFPNADVHMSQELATVRSKKSVDISHCHRAIERFYHFVSLTHTICR